MENWLMDMKYPSMNGDSNELLVHFRSVSTAATKKVWKHIVTHIRPKNEVQIVKKQCLLHRLSNSSPPFFNIEVQLNSLKDFDCYLQMKKDQSTFKKRTECVEEKKRIIAELLSKLEHDRKTSLLEEEISKEAVYKLNHLRKKKKTVERFIQKIENDTKILKVLRTSPNRFVGFGSNVSDWERKVLMYIAELPPGMELETTILKMEELLKLSQFPAPALWDRTETLTEMENVLSSKLKTLDNKKLESIEIDKKLKEIKNNIIEIMNKIINGNELHLLLHTFEEKMLKSALDASQSLTENKRPYILEKEHHTIRRLNYLIESKEKDVSQLLPLESRDCNSSDLSFSSIEVTVPTRPVTRKLINSVLKEVTCFVDLSLRQNIPDHTVDFIQPSVSSYNQLLRLNKYMMIHSKLMVLEEKIRNLNLPIVETPMNDELNNKMEEVCSILSTKMEFIKCEVEVIEDLYDKVKAAFNFLRKEPLNESLMGLQIDGRDISYWLKRFSSSKKKRDHELWLLNSV